jgi:flagellar assembly protein FliH
MSCKIYSGTAPIQPAVWPEVDSKAATRSTPVHFASQAAPSTGEIDKRIAEVTAAAEARVAEARAAGFAAGERAANAKIEPVMERLAKSIQDLSEVRGKLRKQAEADLVKLAIAIARRVLRRELTVDPDAMQGIVLAALDRLQARDISRVRLHPSQEAALRRHLEAAGVRAIELMPDTSLAAGDLLFETSRGTFDASIESQLREIERGFADTLPR